MSNDNQTNIINFSFKHKGYDDKSLTLEEKILQLRHDAIRVLNLVATKNHRLSDEAKESLLTYNRYCRVAGLEPFKLPF